MIKHLLLRLYPNGSDHTIHVSDLCAEFEKSLPVPSARFTVFHIQNDKSPNRSFTRKFYYHEISSNKNPSSKDESVLGECFNNSPFQFYRSSITFYEGVGGG